MKNFEFLTDREHDVLRRVAEGKSNKEIAVWYSISEQTVKFHVNNLIKKLGVNSRVAAAVKSVKLGLLRLSDVHFEGVADPLPPEKKDPRNNPQHAYEAFRSMPASEWIGLNQSLLSGGVLTQAEQQGFERVRDELKSLCLCGRVLPHEVACRFTVDTEQT